MTIVTLSLYIINKNTSLNLLYILFNSKLHQSLQANEYIGAFPEFGLHSGKDVWDSPFTLLEGCLYISYFFFCPHMHKLGTSGSTRYLFVGVNYWYHVRYRSPHTDRSPLRYSHRCIHIFQRALTLCGKNLG